MPDRGTRGSHSAAENADRAAGHGTRQAIGFRCGSRAVAHSKGHHRWEDLERPADIVSRIGQQFGLSIVGLEQVPHDLWAGAAIPDATVCEALSLVLNQFDLTFEWLPHEAGVRLVRVPDHVAIERTYALHGKRAPQTIRILHSLIEGLDAQSRGGKLVVRGTLEQHEIVASVIRGASGSLQPKSKQAAVPIEKQSFMLQAGGVSLQELFVELKKQGLPMEYDAALLKKAGVDLRRKVDIDLPRLPAAEFLTRLLDPYKLTFRFERGTVVVVPKCELTPETMRSRAALRKSRDPNRNFQISSIRALQFAEKENGSGWRAPAIQGCSCARSFFPRR